MIESASQSRVAPNFPLSESPSAYAIALTWLDAGFELCPLQPNTKHFVAGFGPHSKHITDYDGAAFWFHKRRSNLAVVTGNGLVVLDIDEPAALEALLAAHPQLRDTWTVKTKRGVHVYLAGPGDTKSFKRDGVEVKAHGSAVVTWPSRVGDFTYKPLRVTSPMLPCPPDFFLLSASSVASTKPVVLRGPGDDIITRIKSAWTLREICEAMGVTLAGSSMHPGRWAHGRCPMHDDTHASFWIDETRKTFGCFACNFHGDVVNLYAHSSGLSVAESIRAMAKRLPSV